MLQYKTYGATPVLSHYNPHGTFWKHSLNNFAPKAILIHKQF